MVIVLLVLKKKCIILGIIDVCVVSVLGAGCCCWGIIWRGVFVLLYIVVREIVQRKKKLPIQINNQKGDSSDKALA